MKKYLAFIEKTQSHFYYYSVVKKYFFEILNIQYLRLNKYYKLKDSN